MAFVKSGWLLRQSTILKRWKKNWFDLWSDGHLIYYDDQTRQSIEDKVHMPVDCINIRTGHECRVLHSARFSQTSSLQMGSPETVCCRSSAETGRPSVSVQRAQTIAWHGSLHCRIPEQTQLMLAPQSCLKRLQWPRRRLPTQPMLHRPLRSTAMVHTVARTQQELKLSMPPTGRRMQCHTSTHMQEFMDNSLPTKSSSVNGTETVTVTWPWACLLGQPQAWPWALCSGSSRAFSIFCA
ncbi:pleckstrin homology domain containing, family B (evectins) member 2 (predicted), isoform CRA_a [Rattus norvegicus]|uniref:Pleckstrin homology domain containing, family B (Evectins) member 2 (Predicted), isoform CRA_a n=1 Tax=Rattus norvegicus TaxID=10116 RepID=A6INB2_RAT|nr:pleckstrin homology domain containing, family B (evectins) member 2 (predicted), isoform CRA_a [Rattus norvegicus]